MSQVIAVGTLTPAIVVIARLVINALIATVKEKWTYRLYLYLISTLFHIRSDTERIKPCVRIFTSKTLLFKYLCTLLSIPIIKGRPMDSQPHNFLLD